jgi:arylsulfatase A-like enzyme
MKDLTFVCGLMLLTSCGGSPVDTSELPKSESFPQFFGEVPQNLIVISIDTFRIDHMAHFGDTRNLTPMLDRLATEGLILNDHVSCANWTYGGITCANTGNLAVEGMFMPKIGKSARREMPDTPTLASSLRDAGYLTLLETSNIWFSDEYNSDYGFILSERPGDRSATGIFDSAMDLFTPTWESGDYENFYIHMHVKEPHVSYTPPEKYLDGLDELEPITWDLTISDEQYELNGQWDELPEAEQELILQHMRLRYAGELMYLNDQLEDMFDELDSRGLLDNTLVMIWSDHGEQFQEHDRQTHAYSLYSEENDALAILWSKNIVAGEWEGPTSHIDLAPTVLSLLGHPGAEGMSGLPVGLAPDDRPIFAEVCARLGPVQSVTLEGMRLHYRWATGERWLYDLNADPGEQVNLIESDPDTAEALWTLLEPRVTALEPLIPEHTPN